MEPIYIVLEIKTAEHEGGYAVVTSNTRLAAATNPDNANHKRAVALLTNEAILVL